MDRCYICSEKRVSSKMGFVIVARLNLLLEFCHYFAKIPRPRKRLSAGVFLLKAEQVGMGVPISCSVHMCRWQCRRRSNGGKEVPGACSLCVSVWQFPISRETAIGLPPRTHNDMLVKSATDSCSEPEVFRSLSQDDRITRNDRHPSEKP